MEVDEVEVESIVLVVVTDDELELAVQQMLEMLLIVDEVDEVDMDIEVVRDVLVVVDVE